MINKMWRKVIHLQSLDLIYLPGTRPQAETSQVEKQVLSQSGTRSQNCGQRRVTTPDFFLQQGQSAECFGQLLTGLPCWAHLMHFHPGVCASGSKAGGFINKCHWLWQPAQNWPYWPSTMLTHAKACFVLCLMWVSVWWGGGEGGRLKSALSFCIIIPFMHWLLVELVWRNTVLNKFCIQNSMNTYLDIWGRWELNTTEEKVRITQSCCI